MRAKEKYHVLVATGGSPVPSPLAGGADSNGSFNRDNSLLAK